jgi:hypothetical protein
MRSDNCLRKLDRMMSTLRYMEPDRGSMSDFF